MKKIAGPVVSTLVDNLNQGGLNYGVLRDNEAE